MFGSEILETGIGLVLVFLLVSVICAAIREGLDAWFKTRAAYLEHGIRELLHDRNGTGLARQVYQHPLIYSLYSDAYVPGTMSGIPKLLARGESLPSYIPAGNFALALMDIAARGPDPLLASDPSAPVLDLHAMRANIINIRNEPVQRVLLTAIDTAQGDLDRAQKNIQAWYDSGMDRVSGWYKRATHYLLFMIGIAVAVAFNINTITIAEYLYSNDAARTQMVARAEAIAQDSTILQNYERAIAEVDSLATVVKLPIGWSHPRAPEDEHAGRALWEWLVFPLGWLVTALAATMGAPFWFDLLNKMMVIRSTVKPREKSQEEGSEDRQPKRASPAAPAPHTHEMGAAAAPGAPPAGTAAAAAAVAPAAAVMDEPVHDGCDVAITDITHDDELPPAEGGVA